MYTKFSQTGSFKEFFVKQFLLDFTYLHFPFGQTYYPTDQYVYFYKNMAFGDEKHRFEFCIESGTYEYRYVQVEFFLVDAQTPDLYLEHETFASIEVGESETVPDVMAIEVDNEALSIFMEAIKRRRLLNMLFKHIFEQSHEIMDVGYITNLVNFAQDLNI
ncbi:hypothetical protein Dalk_2608 [Desulfatibacillum aliphaticivorans]|uniref:Uncharacterized protein n=1 Tax=Desulfatibacillum aliphaticivorans TaxID=218208 RepID=B8FIR0_DESAL|nr:hypothetical protein [Desulfatibacillum aliphaticivorans]ACL04301.1 hypothetical protein Dalk_2608 [Desulfatibacillum aliphaticivorans]